MMKSVQSKILLVLLLFINVVTPMKLPMIKKFFYDEPQKNAFVALLMLENYTSLGILAFQAASFSWLKKNNSLFGTELISKKIDISGYPFSILPKNLLATGAFSGWLFSILCSIVNTLPQECIHSDANTIINTLLLSSSMIHMSNLIYDDALTSLKKSWKEFRTDLTIKDKIDITALRDAKCLVCWHDEPDKEYANPCAQIDHIFCKECLMIHFDSQKEKYSFVNKRSFLCQCCRKEVPFNDEKFEITFSPQSKVTLKLWLNQVSEYHMLFYFFGMYTLNMLLHTYLF